MSVQAKVIADSVSTAGDRLTTFEVVMHRFVLAEMNTHRAFSRSSASSRAIPFRKQVNRVMADPAVPLVFPAEQPGMQGGDEIEGQDRDRAEMLWLVARTEAVKTAQELADLGVHKSVVNRLLEPFMWHTVVVTSTCWENFFRQRCSPLAQPEIRAAAECMREALDASTPEMLAKHMWHMPYLDADTILEVTSEEPNSDEILRWVSTARCARVSYLTQDGKRDWVEDVKLFEHLVTADPPHWAPLEHVASPCPGEASGGNFVGWRQLRSFVEADRGIDTKV